MKDYWVYYNCPHCPKPCTLDGPMVEGNEGVEAENKTEARAIFNAYKPCRWMKITRIEVDE